MSTLTIDLSEQLDNSLEERVKTSGARSKAEYLLGLVELDCAEATLESVLMARLGGQFAPLEPDWKDQVRDAADKLKLE